MLNADFGDTSESENILRNVLLARRQRYAAFPRNPYQEMGEKAGPQSDAVLSFLLM